jgi:hypothetical protein
LPLRAGFIDWAFATSLALLVISPEEYMFVSEGEAIGGPEDAIPWGEEHPASGEVHATTAINTAATQSIERSSMERI